MSKISNISKQKYWFKELAFLPQNILLHLTSSDTL